MKKIVSILISLLILISSIGFTVANHYCGGQMVKAKLMYVQNELDCGMIGMLSTCEEQGSTEHTKFKKKCCENEFSRFQIENQLKTNELQAPINTELIAMFVYTYINLFLPDSKEAVIPTDYYPPPNVRDLPVQNQAFLI